VTVDAARPS
jgi:hypothetical protein